MFRKGLAGAGATLVLFHVWLLADQVWTGQLAEPERLFRWGVALALAGALVALKRRRASLLGRKAIAIWLLAVLLHAPAVADRLAASGLPALPGAAVTLSQIVLASVTVALLRLLLGFRTPRKASASSPRLPGAVICAGPIGVLSPDAFLRIAPRPPPRA